MWRLPRSGQFCSHVSLFRNYHRGKQQKKQEYLPKLSASSLSKSKQLILFVTWSGVCFAGSFWYFSEKDTTNEQNMVDESSQRGTSSEDKVNGIFEKYDAAIIGGGVVGLAVARELSVSFPERRFLLLEKCAHLVGGAASSGNSGLGCTGYDAKPGSLERQLLRRSAQRHPHLYRSMGLSYEHAKKTGALVVAWTKEQKANLKEVFEANIEAGDTEAEMLNVTELLDLEPALKQAAQVPLGGVLVPREVISEPWIVPIAYAESARLNGCHMETHAEVVAVDIVRALTLDDEINTSQAQCESSKANTADKDTIGTSDQWSWLLAIENKGEGGKVKRIAADMIINCAGLFGDELEAMRMAASVRAVQHRYMDIETAAAVAAAGTNKFLEQGDGGGQSATGGGGHEHRYFKILPRKGQFLVFNSPTYVDDSDSADKQKGLHALQHIIEPVPTQFTKGVIVWRTPYGQVVVGPTAEEQESKTDRNTDEEVINSLKQHGEKVLGKQFVKQATIAGTYAGIRPATNHRDYQIWSNKTAKWICVAGIRSTGLTGSSGIAEYVRCLYEHDTSPASPKKNCTCLVCTIDNLKVGPPYKPLPESKVVPLNAVRSPPMPRIDELRADFQLRGDGCVSVNGIEYNVTHPQCAFGMAAYGRKP